MKTKVNGITMNYEVKGKGKNLVLIHGAGDNLNMCYNQVPVFCKEYRTSVHHRFKASHHAYRSCF